MNGAFDPKHFAAAEPRRFEDLRAGEIFRNPSRTVTAAHFSAFQLLSGDNHPIHYDREYCRAHGHPDMLAHGLQVLAFTAAGAGSFPHVVVMAARIHNQRGDLVLSGEHKYLLRKSAGSGP